MAPSLEESAKQFAQQARNKLEAEVAKKKNAEVKDVTWQGYDSDGNPLVKDKDQTKTARGLGNVSQTKGSKLIYDSQNTVEYKRKAPKKPSTVLPKKERKDLKEKEKSRSLLIPAEIFEDEQQLSSFYAVTYVKRTPASSSRGDTKKISTGSSTDTFTNSASQLGSSQYYNQSYPSTFATQGLEGLSVEAFAACDLGVTVTASVSGAGASANASASAPIGFSDTDVAYDGFFTVKPINSSTHSFTRTLNTNNPTFISSGHFARGVAVSGYRSLPDTLYYYQLKFVDGNDAKYTIYLDDYFTEPVIDHELWHNYITVIENEIIAFSIFYVRTVDTNAYQDYNPPFDYKYRGQINHYWLHTKYNFTTFTKEHRKTSINRSFIYNGWYDIEDKWVARQILLGGLSFSSTDFTMYESRDQRKRLAELTSIPAPDEPDCTGLLSNVFEGDWLYAWRGVTTLNSSNVAIDVLKRFLKFSYKNGKFYEGWDGLMPESWTPSSPASFRVYVPPEGSTYYQTIPDGQTIATITTVTNLIDGGQEINYDDYFNGSQEEYIPDDISSWKTWVPAYYANGRKGPFMVPFIVEGTSDTYTQLYGDEMHREVWFTFTPFIVEPEQP